MITAVARPYAKAIGGTPTAMSWDGNTFTLAFEKRDGVLAQHDIFFPSPTPVIACDGAPIAAKDVTVDSSSSTFTVTCSGSVVTLSRQ